jgi:hypothetical protein
MRKFDPAAIARTSGRGMTSLSWPTLLRTES